MKLKQIFAISIIIFLLLIIVGNNVKHNSKIKEAHKPVGIVVSKQGKLLIN